MKSLGEKLSEQEIENLLKTVDTDGDGQVNYQEFAAMMKDQKYY